MSVLRGFLLVCVLITLGTCDAELVNVATGGTASQSSTWQNKGPNRVIDGNTNSAMSGNSCSHTKLEENPWWKVDLGRPYLVDKIIITNRQDYGSKRIVSSVVRVGNSENIGDNAQCGAKVLMDRAGQETLEFQCDGQVEGRYVSVQMNRKGLLHICEVEVMSEQFVNVARCGTASQSSTWNNKGPQRVIDGNKNSAMSGNSCSHTKLQQNPWWKVDLGKTYAVDKVIITNRQDYGSKRIVSSIVRVGNNENIVGNAQCGKMVRQDRAGQETLEFQCNGQLQGRYVSVQMNRRGILHICEAEVMAEPQTVTDFVNVARGGTASQSSTWNNKGPGRVIDGNKNSAMSGNSCSHTKLEQNPWWKVDLGKTYAVDKVIITNRQDYGSGRIVTSDVRVGNSENIGDNAQCGERVLMDRAKQKTLEFQCNGQVEGRYVSVQMNKRGLLHICEVEVMVPKVELPACYE